MSNLPNTVEPSATSEQRSQPSPRGFDPASPWLEIAGGSAIAGGSYMLVASLIGLAFFGPDGPALETFGVLLIGVFFAAVCAFAIASVFWLVCYLIARSLWLEVSVIWLGAIVGGAAGFTTIAMVALAVVGSFGGPNVSAVLLAAALGPCLATVFGQAGGAWGAWQSKPGAADAAWIDAVAAADARRHGPGTDSSPAGTTTLFQFNLRQLLWMTVWASLLFAGAAATGAPLVVLAVVGIWLVYQTATLFVGAKLLRLVARWRTARRERRGQVAAVAAKK